MPRPAPPSIGVPLWTPGIRFAMAGSNRVPRRVAPRSRGIGHGTITDHLDASRRRRSPGRTATTGPASSFRRHITRVNRSLIFRFGPSAVLGPRSLLRSPQRRRQTAKQVSTPILCCIQRCTSTSNPKINQTSPPGLKWEGTGRNRAKGRTVHTPARRAIAPDAATRSSGAPGVGHNALARHARPSGSTGLRVRTRS